MSEAMCPAGGWWWRRRRTVVGSREWPDGIQTDTENESTMNTK
jgi:hypothetical protein